MQYHTPTSVDEAVQALVTANGDNAAAQPAARVLAGGTDFLVQLQSGRLQTNHIVDIKHIPELRNVSFDSDGITVGAAVAGAELGEHPDFITEWPGVMEAFDLIGSTQIQGRASMGGNLCNASPAADTIPALIAAGAVCNIAGATGVRQIPVETMMKAPGATQLASDELLVSLRFGRRNAGSADAYQRFTPRTEMDIAVVGCGVNLTLDATGICTAARVAIGAVGPTPQLVLPAMERMVGSQLTEADLTEAAKYVSEAAKPINDKRGTIEYRKRVVGVIFKRTTQVAQSRTGINMAGAN